MYKSYSYIVYCFLLMLVTVAKSSGSTVSFRQNMDQVMKQWNCNKPKAQLVYLEDEYDEYNPSAIYLPHAAVASRCSITAGCCKNGQVCSPVEEETVTYIFQQFWRGKKEKKAIALINHLRCECESRSIPKL